jgi:hypothetical protein
MCLGASVASISGGLGSVAGWQGRRREQQQQLEQQEQGSLPLQLGQSSDLDACHPLAGRCSLTVACPASQCG